MSTKKYDTLVFILRGQPIHNAHVEILHRALALTRELIIIVGSADQPRTYKNPFTYAERKMMIDNVLDQLYDSGDLDNTTRVHIEPNIDTIYNDTAWMCRVQGIVSKYRTLGGKTGIIGHKKDESSFYLNMFPQWEVEHVELIEPLHATDIRDLYFREDANMNFIRSVLPQPTVRWLEGWKDSPDYQQIVRERVFIDKYKSQFAALPYPPIFVTADSIVICSGHVLMIKRRAEPGRGLFALVGGFVNQDEMIEDAALRELKEETNIKVPRPVLKGCITKRRVFDAPNRSARGRTITHTFVIELPNGPLPQIKGGDDASKAFWLPLSDIRSDNMFEDHYEQIRELVV
jgi:bifunctional NMN adenylyltransferase/nudix hydrolase